MKEELTTEFLRQEELEMKKKKRRSVAPKTKSLVSGTDENTHATAGVNQAIGIPQKRGDRKQTV